MRTMGNTYPIAADEENASASPMYLSCTMAGCVPSAVRAVVVRSRRCQRRNVAATHMSGVVVPELKGQAWLGQRTRGRGRSGGSLPGTGANLHLTHLAHGHSQDISRSPHARHVRTVNPGTLVRRGQRSMQQETCMWGRGRCPRTPRKQSFQEALTQLPTFMEHVDPAGSQNFNTWRVAELISAHQWLATGQRQEAMY